MLFVTLLSSWIFAAADIPTQALQLDYNHTKYGFEIEVGLNGKDVTMLLDTGAAITVIDQSVRESLDLQFVQNVNVSGGTEVRSAGAIYLAQRITVGESTFENIPVLSIDLNSRGGPFQDGVSGIFSLRTFKGYFCRS